MPASSKKGRSEKHKERRKQREEESQKYASEQLLVAEVHKIENPLNLLVDAFKTYNKNGLNAQITCCKATDCDEETQEWAFQLTKRLMCELYGKEWKDREKRDELLEETAMYLIARQDGKPIGFSHFRFDMDYDIAIVYCYEMQVEEEYQRKGLGKHIMTLLELIAFKTKMKKVLLTVFHDNHSAVKFYKDKLRYVLDETSPSAVDVDWEVNYEILSKSLVKSTS